GGKISLWPCPLGLAATFDPTIVEQFGRIIAIEYRALGIATALSPQIDLATEPRWNRFYGTFGEDPTLTTDMARAYIDGLQSSEGESEISQGWGYQSVNAMVKHWPGGGPEEGGRDAHYSFGKYTVYPGNNLEQHLIPFTQGAFNLKGKTKKAAAIMPYYTVSHGIDPSGNNVGNGFSQYIISDLLRNTFNYEGVVCTDWGITHNYHSIEEAEGKCWGVESLNIDQRHYIALKAGVDQFGGNNDKEPILKAYQMWCDEFGEIDARKRFEKSAEKLLLNIFRTGLFENPYLDPKQTMETVGNPDFMKIGYEAQLKSIVMLKNKNRALPQTIRRKVYLPGVNL
ncbi:MAG: glycoside hydrolase family 3 N-terminal domain-containing protein, partial [Bacteroidales bacterium]